MPDRDFEMTGALWRVEQKKKPTSYDYTGRARINQEALWQGARIATEDGVTVLNINLYPRVGRDKPDFDTEFTGKLVPNDNELTSWSGHFNVRDVRYEVSGVIATQKDGKKYLSQTIKAPEGVTTALQVDAEPEADDDIPF